MDLNSLSPLGLVAGVRAPVGPLLRRFFGLRLHLLLEHLFLLLVQSILLSGTCFGSLFHLRGLLLLGGAGRSLERGNK